MVEGHLRILTAPADVEPFVDSVRLIADAAKHEVGFLPSPAYADAAASGRLWVVVDGLSQSSPAAHLFFGGHANRLSVVQLWVSPNRRGQGIATKLLMRLFDFAEHRRKSVITARVAADLPANGFWQRAGFLRIRQLPPPKSTKRPINVYLKEVAKTLFSSASSGKPRFPSEAPPKGPALGAPVYVIDVNILLDLFHGRSDAPFAGGLIRSALRNDIRLYVTHEFTHELQRNRTSDKPDPALKVAASIPRLPPPDAILLEATVAELDGLLHPHLKKTGAKATNDRSDAVHLATCIHHSVRGFVTRDRNILRHADELFQRFGLEILTAADLAPEYLSNFTTDLGPNIDTTEGRFTTGRIAEKDRPEIQRFLRHLDLPQDLFFDFASEDAQTALIRSDNDLVSVAGWRYRPAKRQVEGTVVIDEEKRGAQLATDHTIELLMRSKRTTRMVRFQVRVHASQLRFIDAAQSRGFEPGPPDGQNLRSLTKTSVSDVVLPEHWRSFREEFRTMSGRLLPKAPPTFQTADEGIPIQTAATLASMPLFDFESAFGPGLLSLPRRPAVIVPIQRGYAARLIPGSDPQGHFFDSEVALRLERAYFRVPDRMGYFGRGTVVVFYVSGSDGGPKEAVAIARTTFCDRVTVKQAEMMTIRQGAFMPKEVESKQRKGLVMVLTFDNLFPFPRRVPYTKLKEIGCVGGGNLATIERLREEAFVRLINVAFGGDD